MINKILGITILIFALAGIVFGVLLIPSLGEYGWTMLFTSLFAILVGVVVYRKGIKGVVESYHAGTPKGLR